MIADTLSCMTPTIWHAKWKLTQKYAVANAMFDWIFIESEGVHPMDGLSNISN